MTSMRRMGKLVLCSSAFGALATSLPEAAMAQADAGHVVDEVIVTAQRRDQNMRDVGISITAATAEQLRDRGITQSQDIAKLTPGIQFDQTSGGGISTVLTIRGVSQSDTTAHQEAPNSVYADDVYLFSVAATSFPLFDLDHVEVLRGPQGTLFGRASNGGLVHFITARPTKEFSGFASLGYGSYANVSAEAALSGPITDRVRFRVSGRGEQYDGWVKNKNPDGRDTFACEAYGVRGQLEADLTDRLTARLQMEYDKSPRHAEGTYKPENFYYDDAGLPVPLPADLDVYGTGPGNDVNGYRDPYDNAQTSSFNSRGFYQNDRTVPSLYLTWSGEGITIDSVSNYTSFSFDYGEDCDGSPLDYCAYDSGGDVEQYSQELRFTGELGDLTYTTGGFYLNIDTNNYSHYYQPVYSSTEFAYDVLNLYRQESETHALFGQLEYQLTSRLKTTFGVRWTRETKDFESKFFTIDEGNYDPADPQNNFYDPPRLDVDFSKATVGELAHSSTDMWAGKIALDYKLSPDHLLFTSVSRGVKGPGFNSNIGGLITNAETPFDGETIRAYEIGSKSVLLDRALTLNLSGFYYDYDGYQAYAFSGLQGTVSNYDARFFGGEVETTLRLPARVRLDVAAAYLNTKVYDVETAYSGVRDQKSIAAPKWTVNASVDKNFYLGAGDLGLQWSFNYVSSRYASVDNNLSTYLEDAFIHNARVTYKIGNVELAAFVNNISDVDKEVFVYDYVSFTGSVIKNYDRPRWWGVSIRRDF